MQAECTSENKCEGYFHGKVVGQCINDLCFVQSVFLHLYNDTQNTHTQEHCVILIKVCPQPSLYLTVLMFCRDYFGGQPGQKQQSEAICIDTDVYSWASISLPDLRKT